MSGMAKYEVIVDGRQFEVEIVRDDGRRAVLRVDGREYEVEASAVSSAAAPAATASYAGMTPEPQPRSSGAAPPAARGSAGPGGMQVRAPMPGLVLQVCVSVGQGVKSGDVLIRLEAMKMENDIESQAEGRVKEVLVAKGDEVQEGQLLLVLEG
jgi:biotin carboxyl carrier protein